MKRFCYVILAICMLTACDLQPHISSIPDSVGDFISVRYPTLLAEPNSDIYKTAVADYGIYASPTLYGNGDMTSEDYVLYSSVDDYMMPAQDEYVDESDVGLPDHDVSEYGFVPDDKVDDLVIPDYKTADLTIPQKSEKTSEQKSSEPVRAPLCDVTIEKGDTLYSVSRKYSVPVNDLVVINKISAPFTLSIGQKLKVPDISSVPKVSSVPNVSSERVTTKSVKSVNTANKITKNIVKNDRNTSTNVKSNTDSLTKLSKSTDKSKIKKVTNTKTVKSESKKSDIKKIDKTKKRTAQKMMSRSSSKFSWPMRGKILSGYGSKSNGLFNDGINIKSTRGTSVSASENGLVAYAGNEVKGMGNLVIIQHSDGWMTVYAHMDSMTVKRGHSVSVGQKIGTVGMSGKVDQPQLHFEIRKGTKAYNPVNYLKK